MLRPNSLLNFQSQFSFPFFPPLNFHQPPFLVCNSETILLASSYQTQYSKNFALVKTKYKKELNSKISFTALREIILSANCENREKPIILNKEQFMKKMHCFLCALAFYEINKEKFHHEFENGDWELFAKLFKMEVEELLVFKEEIFKKNNVNYKWTSQEDYLLKILILKNQRADSKILPWHQIASDFNHYPFISQKRTAGQCQERWRNTLMQKFKTGDWTKEEDLKIIAFVENYGTKWSRLTSFMFDRTEHNLKNRFFSLISRYSSMPIRQVKKSIRYLNSAFLLAVKEEIIAYNGQNNLNQEKQKVEDK